MTAPRPAAVRAGRSPGRARNLVLVLGDQLDLSSAAFDGFDPAHDAVWMAEVASEATHVWSHKQRVALFLSAMRHFRRDIERRGWTLHYADLDVPENQGTLAAELERCVRQTHPQRLVMVEPGEWRVEDELRKASRRLSVPLEVRADRHFLCSRAEFAAWASGRRQLRMEFFYREMRRRHAVLMHDGEPDGKRWNYDVENRQSFGRAGPPTLPAIPGFAPDAITRAVLGTVERRLGDHPGSTQAFDWPVTRSDALRALQAFVDDRLRLFGPYQDAMWTGQPYLFHSRLAAAMNLKLLDPRTVLDAVVAAYRDRQLPLASVEGFVRQVLGWREYVRGIYWRFMPHYLDSNVLHASLPLPAFYWTGDTDLVCLREVIGQTLRHGYAHHIQRLMVTGLFALLLGVTPRRVHEWFLAVYVDAVEWVEVPNTIGMSQFADGGILASKPYAATGQYIHRMSNYCRGCRYRPVLAAGDDACPFTTLYWDFLARNEPALRRTQRMQMQLRNLQGKDRHELRAVRRRADRLRCMLTA